MPHQKGALVSDLPIPTAARLRPPRWTDARLVVGVLLVLGSVVLGSVVVRAADQRSAVYAARGALVPGQRLTEADLVRVDVHLGSLSDRYLTASAPLPTPLVVLRAVPAGELVPVQALGAESAVGVQPLTLVVDPLVAVSLQVGSEVDVYADLPSSGTSSSPAGGAGVGATSFSGPELVLQRVPVSSLPQPSSGLGGSSGTDRAVQIMVPVARVKDLIAAVDRGARMTLVPAPGTTIRVDR
jgi:hypothetical protein